MREYGETWVYESIVGALPGLDLSDPVAVTLQFALFEAGVLALGWYYGLADAVVAGSVAVAVAAAGSVLMLRVGSAVRAAGAPEPYRRLLLGSSVEVVMAVLAFVALVTYLFAVDRPPTLVSSLLGERRPALAVYLLLLVAWDLCYRIGTGWWASVAALWRSVRYPLDRETARRLARADVETAGFALLQLALVPFLLDHAVLLVAVVGHVAAVVAVTGASVAVLALRGS